MIPTIDTGKSRRMAGRPSVTGKSLNNEDAGGPPTLSKNPSNKNYGLFLQEESSSILKGGSKPSTGGGLFGAERSNSPNRDPAGLEYVNQFNNFIVLDLEGLLLEQLELRIDIHQRIRMPTSIYSMMQLLQLGTKTVIKV